MSLLPSAETVAEAQDSADSGSSYRSILKSTSLIGGASVINILIGMVRTKFVAVLLGPTGVGLLGMYSQVTGVVGTLTGLGIGSSGVRQVAEAVGSNDDERIARTAVTLRRAAWLTGGLGLLVMLVFCVPLSHITFGSSDYAWTIAVLGVTLLTGAIAAGQGCIINGTRRIADLAKISIIGAVSGTLISIPCFWLWGEAGIVPSLLISALAALGTSWWFARQIPIKAINLPWRESVGEARQLLTLGASFMAAGLVTVLSNYLIRVVLLRQFSLDDVGIYQAAFGLSGILAGFVLGAMGADYYPRLTAVANDNASVYRMVNEQTQVSILLALPGLAAMMVFAPLVIKIFYSASFEAAVPVLRWCTLGILGRVFSWPMGFVLAAKGKGKLFFITEMIFAGMHLILVWLFVRFWGVNGAGIAFMILYVAYTGMMLALVHKLVGAAWGRESCFLTSIAAGVMSLLMVGVSSSLDEVMLFAGGIVVLCVVTILCLRQLSLRAGIGWQDILRKIGIDK